MKHENSHISHHPVQPTKAESIAAEEKSAAARKLVPVADGNVFFKRLEDGNVQITCRHGADTVAPDWVHVVPKHIWTNAVADVSLRGSRDFRQAEALNFHDAPLDVVTQPTAPATKPVVNPGFVHTPPPVPAHAHDDSKFHANHSKVGSK